MASRTVAISDDWKGQDVVKHTLCNATRDARIPQSAFLSVKSLSEAHAVHTPNSAR
jgi:hypothetical protein